MHGASTGAMFLRVCHASLNVLNRAPRISFFHMLTLGLSLGLSWALLGSLCGFFKDKRQEFCVFLRLSKHGKGKRVRGTHLVFMQILAAGLT